MSDGSSIEWCDATWQPVLGCTRVSPGCDHCYAISVVHRGMSPQHKGLTKLRPKDASRPGIDWNGTVRLQPEKLAEPLRWRKPRRVFVCSLADLFHDAVPFEHIAAVFGVMAATPQHTYLVLTKRPERARGFFAWMDAHPHCDGTGDVGGPLAAMGKALCEHPGPLPGLDYDDEGIALGRALDRDWPLPNVHLGTSVEDQQRADERIPALLACPAAVHWVSAEPLLGPIDFDTWPPLGWIVVGGESGPGARPFDIAWARSIVGYGVGACVPVFVKQLGAKPTWDDPRDAVLTDDRKGGTMDDWPTDLRVREVPT